MRLITAAGCVVAASALGMTALPAAADPGTGRIRDLDCGSAGTLTVEPGPAEFLTTTSAAIHEVGSTRVLLPRRVVVVLPDGTTLVTLDKHQNRGAGDRSVTCSYLDPAGLQVTITGDLSS
jgi:hypothetical protein